MVDEKLKKEAELRGISLSFALEFGLRILLEDNVIKRLNKRIDELNSRIDYLKSKMWKIEKELMLFRLGKGGGECEEKGGYVVATDTTTLRKER